MQASEIKSRPSYGVLTPSALAKRIIVAAEGEGLAAVEAAFAQRDTLLPRLALVYTPGRTGGDEAGRRLEALRAGALHVLPSVETALVRLRGLLDTATMGTQIAATGTESFIGQVIAACRDYGIDPASIDTEHRGSLARRVQCVHCKGFTADVAFSPVACSHCGLWLFVRDHYSRRLGAFMGVCVDAEQPGDIPAREEFRA